MFFQVSFPFLLAWFLLVRPIEKRKRTLVLTFTGKRAVFMNKYFPAWADKLVHHFFFKDVFLIKHDLVKDVRGVFKRSFCKRVLKKYNFDVKQGNISENIKKFTLRGFHYQKLPSKESKIITCVSGKIYNIVLDLRKKSKTYKKWTKIILDNKNKS